MVRLGLGLAAQVSTLPPTKPRLWVHALSVGEVASVVSLVRGLRKEYPHSQIIFSTATRSGGEHARQRLSDVVDLFIPFPLDHWLVVRHFLRVVRADLFVQVETDFWPNFLAAISAQPTVTLLVNGRISASSFRSYHRFSSFFRYLFNGFDLLSMQTTVDARRMVDLGLAQDKVVALGNLKIDAALPDDHAPQAVDRLALGLPEGKRILVAGSTHAGEEEMVMQCFKQLQYLHADLFLVLALRNVERAEQVMRLLECAGSDACRRSQGAGNPDYSVLVVDTLGELTSYYQAAHLVFVGGSLVSAGGHNPLEPAAFARPVCFGPHMEDFADIVEEMIPVKAAVQLDDAGQLQQYWHDLLSDDDLQQQAGLGARSFIAARQGVTRRHLKAISTLLTLKGT